MGGGAAGLMAALAAAEAGAETLVLEGQERPARKLRITGKGRCNLTNNCPPEDVLKNVNRNARFLNSAVRAFPPEEVMAFFEGLGVPLKTERGGRVFPCSDKAADVIDAQGQSAGLELLDHLGSAVIRVEDGFVQFHGKVCGHRLGKHLRSAVGFIAVALNILAHGTALAVKEKFSGSLAVHSLFRILKIAIAISIRPVCTHFAVSVSYFFPLMIFFIVFLLLKIIKCCEIASQHYF